MYPKQYKSVSTSWINSLHVPEAEARTKSNRDPYTIDEVRELVALPAETLTMQRDRAAIAFLFLSDARDGAFVSLPICTVDVAARSVQQYPWLGVHTKFSKDATTFLLEIPDLLNMVTEWDRLVRNELHPNALWYATLARDGMSFTGKTEPGIGRAASVRKGLKYLCQQANIPYRAPHNLRHGHAVYAFNFARDMADRQAIKQNLMHGKRDTTDIYTWLSDSEVAKRIASLTTSDQSTDNTEALAAAFVDALIQNPTALERLAESFSERYERTGGASQ